MSTFIFPDRYKGVSISQGTLKSDALMRAFAPLLVECGAGNLVTVFFNVFSHDEHSEQVTDILQEAFELLNECAPEGYYFGAHETDGADFGFWEEWQ